MAFEFASVSSFLQPYIKQYWGLTMIYGAATDHTQRIIPSRLPEIAFYFDTQPLSLHSSLPGRVLVNAQQNDYYDLFLQNRVDLFSITFKPEGLFPFLRVPVNKLLNQSISAEDLDQRLERELAYQLADTSLFEQRVQIATTFLNNYLLKKYTPSINFNRIQHSIMLIKETKGTITIEALAESCCLSRKQFERIFQTYVGISPKQYCRIIRFQYTIHLHHQKAYKSLTDLFYQAGYYDQSHFINDVKSFTGHTPRQLFQFDDMMSDFFS